MKSIIHPKLHKATDYVVLWKLKACSLFWMRMHAPILHLLWKLFGSCFLH